MNKKSDSKPFIIISLIVIAITFIVEYIIGSAPIILRIIQVAAGLVFYFTSGIAEAFHRMNEKRTDSGGGISTPNFVQQQTGINSSAINSNEETKQNEVEAWRMNGMMRENLKVSSDGKYYYDKDTGKWERLPLD